MNGKNQLRLIAVVLFAGQLTACDNKPDVSGPLTAEQQVVKTMIESRIAGYKDMGAAFKAISDELKAGNAESTTVKFSAKSLQTSARDSKFWFKEVSGIDSGFDTNAKPIIWQEMDAFSAIQEKLIQETSVMVDVANTGDATAIATQFQATGKVCKQCHDKYREDDE